MRVLVVLLFASSFAQAQSASPSTSAQLASTILQSAGNASGWTQSTPVVDAVAQGTVSTFADGSNSKTFLMKIAARDKYRYEITGPESITAIANGPAGSLYKSGKTSSLSSAWAVSARPPAFMSLTDIPLQQDSQVTREYVGTARIGNSDVYGIRVTRMPNTNEPLAALRKTTDQTTVWVSATNWLPVAVDFIRLGSSNPSLVLHYRRILSDYRIVQGVMVPFRQEEYVEGQFAMVFQFSSVSFNQGLPDTEFAVAPFAGLAR